MIDPSRNLVIAYLTNKINSPVTDMKENTDKFDGNWLALECARLIPENVDPAGNHPSVKNFESKRTVFEKLAEKCKDADRVAYLRESIEAAYQHVLETAKEK